MKLDLDLASLPIFRSPEQASILVRLFVLASGPESLTELSGHTGVSPAGVHGEIERLERAGLVKSTRVGRSRLVEPDPASPLHRDLAGLLTRAFGPAERLRVVVEDLPGVDKAFIYGSWARPLKDRAPADIDLMVVGDVDVEELHRRLVLIEGELGRPVNATVLSAHEYESDDTGFLEAVRSGPTIVLV